MDIMKAYLGNPNKMALCRLSAGINAGALLADSSIELWQCFPVLFGPETHNRAKQATLGGFIR